MLSLDSHNYLNVKRFLMWREKKNDNTKVFEDSIYLLIEYFWRTDFGYYENCSSKGAHPSRKQG